MVNGRVAPPQFTLHAIMRVILVCLLFGLFSAEKRDKLSTEKKNNKPKMISTKIFYLRSVVRYLCNLMHHRSCNNLLNPNRQKAVISSSIIRFRTITQAASAEKIQRIVNDISQLTLLDVAELNQVLKTTLKIPDAPVMAYGAGPAAGPVQPNEVIILNILHIFLHL
jgi:hypothetical protein